jgi:GNAT superfamily N-acetyltransferase
MKIKIFEPGYNKREFYGYMGDAFSMPDVKKELPYIGNTKNAVWFLAFDGDDLAGFMAVENSKGKVVFKSGYVYPEYREKGVFREIFEAGSSYAASKFPGLPYITACATPNLLNMLNRYGFKEVRKTKNYTFMETVKND